MKSRKAMRWSVLVNIASHVVFVLAMFKSLTSRRVPDPDCAMCRRTVEIPVSAPEHTFFLVFAVLCFFLAPKSKSRLNLTLVVINILIALYVLFSIGL